MPASDCAPAAAGTRSMPIAERSSARAVHTRCDPFMTPPMPSPQPTGRAIQKSSIRVLSSNVFVCGPTFSSIASKPGGHVRVLGKLQVSRPPLSRMMLPLCASLGQWLRLGPNSAMVARPDCRRARAESGHQARIAMVA